MKETSAEIARRMMDEGYQHQTAGELDDAIRYYQASINFQPTAEAHTYLGWAYSLQGHLEQAISECKHAIELDPSYGNPYNDIGAYLIAMGKLDESLEWLKKAIFAPRYEHRAYPLMNLGRVYELKGLWSHALRAYRRALKVDPSHLEALDAYQLLLGKFN
jgi:Tfp pilus assembly protein PilF